MGLFGRKPGKKLEENRLTLEDSLEYYTQQLAALNDNYIEQMQIYQKHLKAGEAEAKDAAITMKCAESTKLMIAQITAQQTELYKQINQNSEITKRDSDKANGQIGTAVGVGTALGSLTLGALSLSQAVVTDNEGLMTRKNVKRFLDSINPIRIMKH